MTFDLLPWRQRDQARRARRYYTGLMMIGALISVGLWFWADVYETKVSAMEQALDQAQETLDALNHTFDKNQRTIDQMALAVPKLAQETQVLSQWHAMTDSMSEHWLTIVDTKPQWVWLDGIETQPIVEFHPISTHQTLITIKGRALTSEEVLIYQGDLVDQFTDADVSLIEQRLNEQGLSSFVMRLSL